MNLTPTPARDVFTIGRESFTLKFQGIAVDGTPLRVGGPALTVDGTRVSLGPSELVVGNKTETFTPATGDPLVEINGVKGGAGAGVGAGTKGIAETSAGAGAGLGSALMSGLGAIGGGAATPTNGSGPGGNGRAAAPFSGTASKVGDGANLWVRIGSGFWVVRCLIGV